MNGYALRLRIRRPGASAATERSWELSDAALKRTLRLGLFVLGAALFLLAPFAMAALTRPENGDKDLPLPDVMNSLPHFS